MTSFYAILVVFAASLICAQNPSTGPMPRDKALETARQYAADFFQGKSSAVWQKMDGDMHAALKTEADWDKFTQAALQQLGKETQLHAERLIPAENNQVYSRLFSVEAAPMKMQMVISLAPDGRIAGFFIRPEKNAAESHYLDYRPKTPLRFPLGGEWIVYQGGRTVSDNYHAEFPHQRFAYDLLAIRDGRLQSGDGAKLEDHFSLGVPVLAAAAGKVVWAVDQYDDNPVNKVSKQVPSQGNSVVLDHLNGEYTFYAHLRRGSVKVKQGDAVKAGQPIGDVGNSGNSPVPHLHFHMQNTANWSKGDGLPTPFASLLVNGKKVENAEPVRGDVIKME